MAVEVETTGDTLAILPGAAQALAMAGLLLAALAVALVVQALTSPMHALYVGQWPARLAVPAHRTAPAQVDRTGRGPRAAARRAPGLRPHTRTAGRDRRSRRRANRIAMADAGPAHTWTGDRMHAVDQVAINRYGVDLTFCWPRLWLVLPDSVCTEPRPHRMVSRPRC